MNSLIGILYGTAMATAGALSSVAPAGRSKISRAFRARRGISERYATWAAKNRDASRPLLWVHAPSVGEGLQALPVIELIRERHPEAQIAYTFFSPSAEQIAGRVGADFADYLPFDTARSASRALDALRPSALVFSKLDVWPVLVESAARRGVRVGMISATMPSSSKRRSPIARLALSDSYGMLDVVGAVSDADAGRLIDTGVRPERISITGDTRYDQVWKRATLESPERRALTARLGSTRLTLVAGSTWPSDEDRLLPAWVEVRESQRDARLVIAPHEISEKRLSDLESWAATNGMAAARVGSADASRADVLLVDRYGILGDMYAIADVAYVGGGFRKAGLHSLLEPASFGAPVLIGPEHTDNRDAAALISAGGAARAADSASMAQHILAWISSAESRNRAGEAAREVVRSGLGAAERSLALVEGLLFRQRA